MFNDGYDEGLEELTEVEQLRLHNWWLQDKLDVSEDDRWKLIRELKDSSKVVAKAQALTHKLLKEREKGRK